MRTHESKKILCVFNLSESAVDWSLPAGVVLGELLTQSGVTGAEVKGSKIHLTPWGGMFAQIA